MPSLPEEKIAFALAGKLVLKSILHCGRLSSEVLLLRTPGERMPLARSPSFSAFLLPDAPTARHPAESSVAPKSHVAPATSDDNYALARPLSRSDRGLASLLPQPLVVRPPAGGNHGYRGLTDACPFGNLILVEFPIPQ
jgi:hypothetical protein